MQRRCDLLVTIIYCMLWGLGLVTCLTPNFAVDHCFVMQIRIFVRLDKPVTVTPVLSVLYPKGISLEAS